MKNKYVSALLSLVFPGCGQLYIGKWIDGTVFVTVGILLWGIIVTKGPQFHTFNFDNPRALLVGGALIFIYAYSMIDAYRKTT